MGEGIRNTFIHSERDEHDNHNSPEITVRHELANDITCTSPGAIRKGSPEFFPMNMWIM